MFRVFRDLVAELRTLNEGLHALVKLYQTVGPAEDRLTALERSRAQFEADVQGLLQKADGKLKAANNSEARERTMRKSYLEAQEDADFDNTPPVPGSTEDYVAAPGGMDYPPNVAYRATLELSPKERAINRKWGGHAATE